MEPLSYQRSDLVSSSLESAQKRIVREARIARQHAAERCGLTDFTIVRGYGLVVVRDAETGRERIRQFRNLVTTAGDQYHAKKVISGVSPAAPSAPTLVNGMKLGTGTATPTKSSTNSALGSYISGSNAAFDATFPQGAAVAGVDTGWQTTYQTTWAAGTATNSAITEAVLVNDSGTDATSTSANTYARVTFTAENKTSTEILTIIWNNVFLGA